MRDFFLKKKYQTNRFVHSKHSGIILTNKNNQNEPYTIRKLPSKLNSHCDKFGKLVQLFVLPNIIVRHPEAIRAEREHNELIAEKRLILDRREFINMLARKPKSKFTLSQQQYAKEPLYTDVLVISTRPLPDEDKFNEHANDFEFHRPEDTHTNTFAKSLRFGGHSRSAYGTITKYLGQRDFASNYFSGKKLVQVTNKRLKAFKFKKKKKKSLRKKIDN